MGVWRLRSAFLVFAGLTAGGCSSGSEASLSPEELSRKARSLQRGDDHQEAIRLYSLAVEKQPRDHVLRNNRAAAYFDAGEYDKAIEDLTAAIRFGKEGAPEPYLNRARMYSTMKRYDEALVDLNKAIKIDPKRPEAYMLRAGVYSKQQKLDLMERDVKKAEALGFKLPELPPDLADRLGG